MKAKELIKILEAVNPESKVALQLGGYREEEYREVCAKAEIMSGECLDFLRIDSAIIHSNDEDTWVNLILRQFNYTEKGLHDSAEEFDKYIKKEG